MVDAGLIWYEWANCLPDCPLQADIQIWRTDDTLKVTHSHLDQKEIMIAVKLLAILSSSLLLISLIVKVQGTSDSEI